MGKGIDADAVVGGATDMGSSTFVMVLRWAPEQSLRRAFEVYDDGGHQLVHFWWFYT